MYRKILLAYDGTETGRVALRQGADLAKVCGAEVFLLAVVDLPTGMLMAESAAPSGLPDTQRQEFERILEEGVERLKSRELQADARLEFGVPAERIVQWAQEIGADLIVLGHRERSPIARWWRGSIGSTVLSQAPCSILIAVLPADAEAEATTE
ncbi:MAG: universal stress protein [Rhodospirillales bacterium]